MRRTRLQFSPNGGKLARPKGFGLLPPRFEVWTAPLKLLRSGTITLPSQLGNPNNTPLRRRRDYRNRDAGDARLCRRSSLATVGRIFITTTFSHH